jgi:hypothetical protein
MLARIESPTAFDAEGRKLPVSYRLTRAGFDIRVAHRKRDVRYPLMVDPIVAVNPANWNAAGSSANFDGWTWSQCCPWRSMGQGKTGAYGWGLYHFVYGSTYYDGGEWAAWRFKPPGDSYVQRSVYTNMRMSAPNGNRSVEQGIQRANGAWVPNGWWDDGIDQPAAYSGGSPWGTSVPFTAANREQHNPFPQAGDQAVTIFRVNASGWTSNQPDQFYIGAATNYVGDDNAPYNVGETGINETGAWQREISNVNVYAADGGTGVRSIRMVAVDPDTGNDRWGAPERLQSCTPWCPQQTAAGSYVPLDAPEGISNLQVRAKDLVGNESRDRQIPVKVDRSGPDMSARWGTMWDNRTSPFFNDADLHMWVTDGVYQGTAAEQRSGVKSVVLSIDGWDVVAGGNSSCPQGSCGASLDFNFVPSRWDAGRYTAKLTATDFAGNVSTDQWTVYIGHWASKEYGGANRTVDSDAEKKAIGEALETDDDVIYHALWSGLSPTDQTLVAEFVRTPRSEPEAPGDTLGESAETDEPVAEVSGVPDPARDVVISCHDGKVIYGLPAGLPRTTRLKLTYLDSVVQSGETYRKVQIDVRTRLPYQNLATEAGVAWENLSRRPGTNASYPYRTSTQRDVEGNRYPRMPWYFHTSAWVRAGGTLRFRAKARHTRVFVAQVGDKQLYTFGANYPRKDNTMYRCVIP